MERQEVTNRVGLRPKLVSGSQKQKIENVVGKKKKTKGYDQRVMRAGRKKKRTRIVCEIKRRGEAEN